jgi:hypothetical protein
MAETRPDNAEQELVDEILRRAERMVQDRGTLDAHLEEVAARVMPHYKGSFAGQGAPRNQGEKRNQEMYDSTAALALTKFAAVMESILTPYGSKWQRIVPTDKGLMRNRQVREWYEDTTDRLFAYRNAPKANYRSQKQEDYLQLGAFGTAPLFMDRLVGGPGLRYKSCSLAGTYFQVNHQGMVDTVYRRIDDMTARQANQRWGKSGKLPKEITDALAKNPETLFEFWHCVQPRADVDYNRADHKGMAFASYYVSKTGKKLVEEGGYHTFPYSVSRHIVAPGEVYGRSPAMLVLPNIKTLNEQKRTVLKQGHRIVDPVILLHDDGVMDGFSLKAGALNYGAVNAEGRPLAHVLPTGNLAVGKDLMDDERITIKDAFFVNLFEILMEDRREMTATEVLERIREKGVLLAPVTGRQYTEALGPQTEREIDLLSQQGLLLPMPAILREAHAEWKAEYDSPLSRAMRAEEATGFYRWSEIALKVATEAQDPSALDWINMDAAMPELAEINAVPFRWVATLEQVQARRDGRNQAQRTQQLIEAAPAAAGLVKAMQP